MPITTSKNYICLPPGANVVAEQAVSASGADPDYPVSYLTDNRPAFPIRFDAGGWSASAVATGPVQLVVLANTSIDSTVTVSGLGSMAAGALGANGIRKNPFLLLDAPSSPGSVGVSGTNSAPTLIGELLAGVPFELRPFKMVDANFSINEYGQQPQGKWQNVPMHDDGMEGRTLSGSQVYTEEELANLIAWKEGQRTLQRPGVVILDPTINDARVVLITQLSWKPADRKSLFDTSVTFVEFPRYRW